MISTFSGVFKTTLFHVLFKLETLYSECEEPGLNETDMEASIATLEAIATSLNAQCTMLREKAESEGKVKEFLVRKETDTEDFMEVR